MAEPDAHDVTRHASTGDALREADISDLEGVVVKESWRITLLGLVGLGLIIWALFEAATPLQGMSAALIAILPLKAAVTRYFRATRRQQELLSESSSAELDGDTI